MADRHGSHGSLARCRTARYAGCFVLAFAIGVSALAAQAQSPDRAATPAPGRGSTTPAPAASPTKPSPPTPGPNAAGVPPTIPTGVPLPPGYVIGPDDILSIVYWRDKDMTADVTVRPDGKISLSLVNDVQAAGQTPEQLREKLTEASKEFIQDPTITVVVKEIHSRAVYITGEITKPGPYQLTQPTTVLQLIALAGGLRDYADSKKIVIVRTVNGYQVTYAFNYNDVSHRVNLKQNIELKPGDTVIVP